MPVTRTPQRLDWTRVENDSSKGLFNRGFIFDCMQLITNTMANRCEYRRKIPSHLIPYFPHFLQDTYLWGKEIKAVRCVDNMQVVGCCSDGFSVISTRSLWCVWWSLDKHLVSIVSYIIVGAKSHMLYILRRRTRPLYSYLLLHITSVQNGSLNTT